MNKMFGAMRIIHIYEKEFAAENSLHTGVYRGTY